MYFSLSVDLNCFPLKIDPVLAFLPFCHSTVRVTGCLFVTGGEKATVLLSHLDTFPKVTFD